MKVKYEKKSAYFKKQNNDNVIFFLKKVNKYIYYLLHYLFMQYFCLFKSLKKFVLNKCF